MIDVGLLTQFVTKICVHNGYLATSFFLRVNSVNPRHRLFCTLVIGIWSFHEYERSFVKRPLLICGLLKQANVHICLTFSVKVRWERDDFLCQPNIWHCRREIIVRHPLSPVNVKTENFETPNSETSVDQGVFRVAQDFR